MIIMNDKFYITRKKPSCCVDISSNRATIVRIFLGSRTRKYAASYYVQSFFV